MKLVDDWKQAWKWFSVNCMAIAMAIQGGWVAVPDDMKATLPHNLVHYATLILLVAGIAGRMVKQPFSGAEK